MPDAWKQALEWYIYYTDRTRKAKYAYAIMRVKDELSTILSKGELTRHYASSENLCERALGTDLARAEWLDRQMAEDVAYGLRCLELTTGRRYDLLRQSPSRWVIETVA